MATIPSYFEGLLTPEDLAGLRSQALTSGLLSAGQALARSGAPSLTPGGGTGLAGAAAQFYGGYQGTIDSALQNMIRAQQVQEGLRKQKEAQQMRQLMQSALVPTYGTETTTIPTETYEDVTTTRPKVTGYTYDIQKVLPQLQATGNFAAIKDIADSMSALRKAGFMTGGEQAAAPSPFAPYTMAESPQVKTLANQLQTAFNRGVITEEQAYQRLQPLAQMEESYLRNKASTAEAAAKAAEGKKPTEGERKAATLAGRLEGALKDLSTIKESALKPEVLPSLLQGLSIVPGAEMLAGKVSTEDRLRAEAAQLDALDAALTLGTGAAYTREQLRGYARSYFPQIGDTPNVIQEKNDRFARLVALAREQSGPAGQAIDIAKEKAPSFNKEKFKKDKGLE
jgi:hypothetical protein